MTERTTYDRSTVSTYSAADREHIALSGLTEYEAREFNKLFLWSLLIFLVIAFAAHLAVYFAWRPWLATPIPPMPIAGPAAHLIQPVLSMFG